jgi:hypothetical protein
MAYGTVNADVIGTSVAGSNIGAGNASIMKNRIINGAMVIDQRNAGASGTGTGVYTVDRWKYVASQASKGTWGQNLNSVTPPAGFTNYLGFQSSSAYSIGSGDYFGLIQIIEGYNCADLGWGTANAKTVTFSFWVYSSLTGTFGGSLNNGTNAGSYPFTYTISSANTWQQISVTIAGDTGGTWVSNNGAFVQIWFGLGIGSTYSGTAGSWNNSANSLGATGATSVVGTSGATFYITGVQLEVGSSATGYEYVNYQTSLANCQRYYYLHASALNKLVGSGQYSNSTRVDCSLFFKTSMRATPSLVQVTGTDFYTIYANNIVDNFNGFNAIDVASTEGCSLYNTSNVSGTSGAAGLVYTNNASASIAFTAEL